MQASVGIWLLKGVVEGQDAHTAGLHTRIPVGRRSRCRRARGECSTQAPKEEDVEEGVDSPAAAQALGDARRRQHATDHGGHLFAAAPSRRGRAG